MPGPKGTHESVFGADETEKDKEKKVTPVVESNNLSPIIPKTEQPSYQYDWFGGDNQTKTPEVTTHETEKQKVVEKPKVDETEKQKVDETEKTEIPAPKKSEYEFNTQFVKDLYGEDLESVDEKNKRKRAATAINAIGHLGNALSAVNNMVWSGQHAPSQTLPTINNNMVQAYEDKYGARRKDYLNAIHAGRAADLQEFNQAYSRFNADRQYKLEKDKMAQGQERWNKTFKHTKEKDNKEINLKEEANEIAMTNANANLKRANAYATGRVDEDGNPISGRGTKTEYGHLSVYNPTTGKAVPMTINWSRINDATLKQLYDRVGGPEIKESDKQRDEYDITGTRGSSNGVEAKRMAMRSYIGSVASTNPELYNYLVTQGIGQPIPVSRAK